MLTEMKRTKPSLSIVNPLDVLRQRLLLEIARRQMRENSKQVGRWVATGEGSIEDITRTLFVLNLRMKEFASQIVGCA